MKKFKSLSLKEARVIVKAVIEASESSEGAPMAAAVVDRNGDLLYEERMDGASPLTVRMSLNKAKSAIDANRDTIAGRKMYESLGLKVYEFCSPTYTLVPSGCLIKTKDGSVAGAVGTSGRAPLAPMGDEELSRIGIKAFEESESFMK